MIVLLGSIVVVYISAIWFFIQARNEDYGPEKTRSKMWNYVECATIPISAFYLFVFSKLGLTGKTLGLIKLRSEDPQSRMSSYIMAKKNDGDIGKIDVRGRLKESNTDVFSDPQNEAPDDIDSEDEKFKEIELEFDLFYKMDGDEARIKEFMDQKLSGMESTEFKFKQAAAVPMPAVPPPSLSKKQSDMEFKLNFADRQKI